MVLLFFQLAKLPEVAQEIMEGLLGSCSDSQRNVDVSDKKRCRERIECMVIVITFIIIIISVQSDHIQHSNPISTVFNQDTYLKKEKAVFAG